MGKIIYQFQDSGINEKKCFIEYSTESFQVIKSPPAATIIILSWA
jgi:hypothetical protein